MSQKKLQRAPPVKPHEHASQKESFEITVLSEKPECPECERLIARIAELEERLLLRDDKIRVLQDEALNLRYKLEKAEGKAKIPPILSQIPEMPKSEFSLSTYQPSLQESEAFGSDIINLRSQSISSLEKCLTFTYQLQVSPPTLELTDRLETLQNSYIDLENDPMFIKVENQVMDSKPVFFIASNRVITQVSELLDDLDLRSQCPNQEFFALSAEPFELFDLDGCGFESVYIDCSATCARLDGNYGQITLFGCANAEINILCKNTCIVGEGCIIRWV